MKTPRERHFLEATLENAEVVVDSMIENEVIASIPVIGTAIKICKGLDDIRSRAFAAKLERFVEHPHLSSQAAKVEIVRKIRAAPDESRRVGEVLFLVLDRFIDLDKPNVLATVFVAYLRSDISVEELQRLAQAIDIAFSGDLRSLLTADEHVVLGTPADSGSLPWMETLIPSGLTINVARGVGIVRMACEVTPLGRTLWRVSRDVQAKP